MDVPIDGPVQEEEEQQLLLLIKFPFHKQYT